MLKEIFMVSNYQQLPPDAAFADKLTRVFKTYGLVFLALIAIAPLLLLADKFVTTVLHHKSLNDLNKLHFQQLYKKLGVLPSVFFICFLGPVFEELVFRYGLVFTKRKVVISLLIAVFYLGGAVIFRTPLIYLKLGSEVAVALAVFGLCYVYIPDAPLNITPLLQKQFTVLSIILFGLMHASNFRPMEWGLIWLYPIYVLPQLLMGWGITYIRLKNGFAWGIVMHCLINSVSTLLSLWVKK